MVIKEFNFFLKTTQDKDSVKQLLLPKLNSKCNDELGYIANVYDIEAKKKYILISDNIKEEYLLENNIFEFEATIKDIELSEYYTKVESNNVFATKEELAQIQVGNNVDLSGYLTEIQIRELITKYSEESDKKLEKAMSNIITESTVNDMIAKATLDNSNINEKALSDMILKKTIVNSVNIGEEGIIDISKGNYFILNMTKNTTLKLENEPNIIEQPVYSFLLEVSNANLFSLQWFKDILWSKKTAPIFNGSSRNLFAFVVTENNIFGLHLSKELGNTTRTRNLSNTINTSNTTLDTDDVIISEIDENSVIVFD